MGDVWAATRAWVEQPFRSTMSLWGWVLFVGIIGAAVTLWSRVLSDVGE